MPERDIDLLTLIAFEGYSQREVAEIRGIAPAAICKKNSKNFCMGVNFCLFSLPTK